MLVQGDMSSATGAMLVNNPNVNMQLERRLRNMPVGGVEVANLFTEEEQANKDALIAALEKRLLQAKLRPKQEEALREYLDSKKELTSAVILNAIRLVMSTPDYQLT